MAILMSIHALNKSFSTRPLFDSLTFSIESNQRIGLIGPNGAGKSTLLRILAGKMSADSGTVSGNRGLSIGFLEQVPAFKPGATVYSTLMEGAQDPDDWQAISLADELMSKLSFVEGPIDALSGGWKKRVALARELMRQPELLFLDEPTNHLDVEGILWLENLLSQSRFATVTITHDRVFLQRVSNRILELDRRNAGGLLSVDGDYAKYLETKESVLAAQESQETRLRNTLRRETEWLRQGAKARTTKQQARIQRAGELKDRVEELGIRNQSHTVRLEFQETERNPKKLLEAKGISKAYGGNQIIPQMDLLITAKTRLGLLGNNGCGKSTLIRLLLGHENPDTGTVVRSDQLKAVYFEQNRDSLDPELTVLKTVCPYGETVEFGGRKLHVRSYLDRFLFSGGQVDMAVGKLSGGEQSRLLLALLMLKEASLLILDEPTNDLDMATLDVLQNVLQDFGGAVVIVTHDRYFLDQVADRILAFGRDDKDRPKLQFFTGLSQWEAWYEDETASRSDRALKAKGVTSKMEAAPLAAAKKKKLGFKEQRELDGMEPAIHKAESRLRELEQESAKPEMISKATRLAEISKEMAALHSEIERLYVRWQELSGE